MKEPNFFIVGQPKSGTTALHQFLGQHPQIFMSGIKEPHFFCQDFHQESDRYYGKQRFFDFRTEAEYLQLFAKADTETIVGESSTNYLYSQVTAQNIYQFNPKAKILIVLREPAKYLYSLHSHYLKFTEENEADFERALALEPQRREGKFISPRVTSPCYLYYSDRVKYYEQIERYYDLFDRSQIKIVLFEDFKANNQEVYREILDFLGVDNSFVPEYEAININKEVRFQALNNLVNNPVLKNISKTLVSQEFNEFIRDKIVERFLWHQSPKEVMPDEIKYQLMERYRAEVVKVSKLIDTDLEARWGYKQLKSDRQAVC
ncbi:sulfotransferase [Myxosarcina sp. GI1]|uniref:sulfotransferase family protein n=1 Tax=Myxosarcina sp. GI1 TaxID=1541065 RepID=UPI00055D742F|nr:sulfotransferase [Myxosarcina sp. GI1]